MKRSLAIFITALLLSSPLWLARPIRATATTTTLTGTLTDAQGNPLNGYILAQLPAPAQYTPANIAVTTSAVRCNVVYGALQTCPPLYDVAALQPQNLYYVINAYNSAGQFVMGGNYSVTGATFNLGAATPTSILTNNVSYLNPVSLSANNTFTGNNTFTLPVSVSALGVAPFSVLSNTLVTNLNAQLWNGVQLTNNPVAGQVPVSVSSSTAAWENIGQVVYNTPMTPANTSQGPVVMFTPSVASTFRFTAYIDQTALGSGCSSTASDAIAITFTDPNTSTPAASSLTVNNIVNVVNNGTVGSNNTIGSDGSQGSVTLRAKAGTTISVSTSYANASGCSSQPIFQVFPLLEQITQN